MEPIKQAKSQSTMIFSSRKPEIPDFGLSYLPEDKDILFLMEGGLVVLLPVLV
jgi:hypothetical protein